MAKNGLTSKKEDAKFLKTVIPQKKTPWWKKLLLAPFKLLWWIIKKVLGLLTLGLLSGAFDNKNK